MTPVPSTNPPAFARAISIVSGILVMALAVASFSLSFHAIRDLASQHGFKTNPWLMPLILDGSIIVFSLAAMRAQLFGQKARYEMLLVLAATFASVVFNIAHAPADALARLLAIVPPLCLFLAFEVLARQIRSEVERTSALAGVEELSVEVASLRAEKEKLSKSIHRATGQTEVESPDKCPTGRELLDTANARRRDKIQERRSKVFAMTAGNFAPKQIADSLGVSLKTIQRDLAMSGLSS